MASKSKNIKYKTFMPVKIEVTWLYAETLTLPAPFPPNPFIAKSVIKIV